MVQVRCHELNFSAIFILDEIPITAVINFLKLTLKSVLLRQGIMFWLHLKCREHFALGSGVNTVILIISVKLLQPIIGF